MSKTLALPAALHPDRGLAAYVRAVNAMPLLSAEEEKALAVRYHHEGDLDAARQLVLSHLRYVVGIARGFSGYGLAQADLIQEGNIGLMKAVKNFDPERGVRLLSFAVHWIKAEIYDFVLRNWRIVKVATTKAQRKLFFNLRKHRARLGWMKESEIDALAETLDVAPATVKEMESRLSNADVPYDLGDNAEEDGFVAPASFLPDNRFNPERLVTEADQEDARTEQLQSAMVSLDDRSRDIIRRRWLDENKATLHELAAEYGISAERVRQIEARALGLMRNKLTA